MSYLPTRVAAAAAAGTVLLAGCGSTSSSPATNTGTGTTTTSATGKKTVTVLAAASLTEAFKKIAADVMKQHPDLDIKISFGASSTLATQLNNGVDADIIALADEKSKTTITPSLIEGKPTQLFATNRLEIATPAGNPAHVTGLASLSNSSIDTVLCAKQVPCGRAAQTVLTKADVTPHVISFESDVKATLAKVKTGDADAAIVYQTDVSSAGSTVTGVVIPEDQNTVTKLPIVQLTNTEGAKEFYEAVTSSEGQDILKSLGFGQV